MTKTHANQPHSTPVDALVVTTTEGAETLPALMTPESLGVLGLKPEDAPAIRELANRLNSDDPLTVSVFGRDIAEQTSSYSDELLSQVKNKDLDEAGEKLSRVIAIAKGLNMNALSNRRSRLPIVGAWIDKLTLSASGFKGQFETTSTQIDGLIGELDQTQQGLSTRITTMEQMFHGVKTEYHMLGLHIAAGKVRMGEFRTQIDGLRASVNSPADVQDLADREALLVNLEIRVGNLMAMQQSALQTLPQIRVLQTNNQVLVDKFHTIKEVTIPAWKRQFVLRLGLNEQRNAVILGNNIDDATNDLLKQNAELLHHNAVETARSNQRLVIDVDTLQDVQTNLIKTVEDVIKIQREGAQQRQKFEAQIKGMQSELRLKLTHSDAKVAA